MRNRTRDNRNEVIFSIFATIIALISLTLATFNIWNPYSYWFDEMFSVAASNVSIQEMFSEWILPDVHPPLYQLLLWGWIRLVGDSEPATRSLSLGFSIITLLVFYRWGKKHLTSLSFAFAMMVFATSRLFAFYAQETRSYALLLLLATFTTIFWLGCRENQNDSQSLYLFLLSSLALSWTHFFGLVYVGLLICWSLWDYRSNPKTFFIITITGILCNSWMITHLLIGNLLRRGGGNFWIDSDGIQTTVANLVSTMPTVFLLLQRLLTWFTPINHDYAYLTVFIVFLLFYCWHFFLRKKIQSQRQSSLFILVIIFLSLISLIDLNTPISTYRNFIVLLPAIAIVCGEVSESLFTKQKNLALMLLTLIFVVNLTYTSQQMNAKWAPRQNYKDATEFMVEKSASTAKYSLAKYFPFNQYYFNSYNLLNSVKPVEEEELSSLQAPYAILLDFSSKKKIQNALDRLNDLKVEVFEPKQSWINSVVVLYKD